MIGQFVMRGLWLHDGTNGHEWGMGNRDMRGQLVMITPCDQLSPHVIITPSGQIVAILSSCHDYSPYVTIIPLNHDYPCHVITHQMSWLPPLIS